MHAAQKLIGTRVISDYRTISMIAVFMLARILPIETQARILKKVYKKKKEWIETGRQDGPELQKYYRILIEDEINKWKNKLNKPTLPGRRTRMAILPHLSRWFNRTHSGAMSYRITQILTGHGCFAEKFLYRIGKYETPNCGFCDKGIDNAQHTLQGCPKWEIERIKLRNRIGEDLQLVTVVSRILENKGNWQAFYEFAEEVMTKKKTKEREEEETLSRIRRQRGEPAGE